MSTRLDQEIEQLQHMVETRLGLCQVTNNGVPCVLPANHQPAEGHTFAFAPQARIEHKADAARSGQR